MTINVKETATLQDSITTPVDKRCKPVYCIDNGKRWDSAIEAAEELGATVWTIYMVCNGRQRTCKGFRLCYEENVAELRDKMAMEINAKNAELEAERELANKWRAYEAQIKAEEERIRAEQEAIRKAEEEHLKAIEDTKTALIKANERKERRQRIVEQKDADLQKSVSRLMETEKEIEELTIKLLKLEGTIKEA